MKRKTKCLAVYLLVGVLASSSVMMSYNQAREVKAVAVVDDTVFFLVAFLASAGLALDLSQFVDVDLPKDYNPDVGIEWKDETWIYDLDESLEEYLKEAGAKLDYSSTGFQPGDDEDGDGDPDSPEDPGDLNSWKDFFNKAKGKLGVSGAIGSVVFTKMAYDRFQDYQAKKSIDDYEIPDEVVSANYKYHLSYYDPKFDEMTIVYSNNIYAYIDYLSDKNGLYGCMTYVTEDAVSVFYNDGVFVKTSTGDISGYFQFSQPDNPNYRIISYNFKLGENADLLNRNHKDPNENIVPGSDLSNSMKDNPDISNVTTPDSVRTPTGQELVDYLRDLIDSKTPEDKQKAVDDFMNTITKPAPTDPDVPVDPDNPGGTTDPDNPDKPDPDNPGGSTGTDEKPFLADLKELFPFCIPFDLVHAFKVLSAEGSPPRWEVPLKVPMIGLDYVAVLDFKDYDSYVQVFRTMEVLAFIVGLILVTRSLIKG